MVGLGFLRSKNRGASSIRLIITYFSKNSRENGGSGESECIFFEDRSKWNIKIIGSKDQGAFRFGETEDKSFRWRPDFG